jgi:hypothetical protein
MNQKDEIKKIIDQIDQSQLAHSDNSVSVYDRVDDLPKDFAKLDKPSDEGTKGESELPLIPEMSRYCKKHDVPSSVKVTGQESTK